MEELSVDMIRKICSQLDQALMPTFSGNGVNTFINKLNTKKINLAIDKK